MGIVEVSSISGGDSMWLTAYDVCLRNVSLFEGCEAALRKTAPVPTFDQTVLDETTHVSFWRGVGNTQTSPFPENTGRNSFWYELRRYQVS